MEPAISKGLALTSRNQGSDKQERERREVGEALMVEHAGLCF